MKEEFSVSEKVIGGVGFGLFLLWCVCSLAGIFLKIISLVLKDMSLVEIAAQFNSAGNVMFLVMFGGLFIGALVGLVGLVGSTWNEED